MKTNLSGLLVSIILLFTFNCLMGQDNHTNWATKNERGIVLQNPPTREYSNNIKDTADHIIYYKNDTIWIQFYKNEIYFNHKFFGNSEIGDTIRLNFDGKLEIIRKGRSL